MVSTNSCGLSLKLMVIMKTFKPTVNSLNLELSFLASPYISKRYVWVYVMCRLVQGSLPAVQAA